MKGALEARCGGGAKKGTDSERRAAKQLRRRSAELQTKQKNTTEVAKNKSKYKENQKQIQGNKYKQIKAKTGMQFGRKPLRKVAMEAWSVGGTGENRSQTQAEWWIQCKRWGGHNGAGSEMLGRQRRIQADPALNPTQWRRMLQKGAAREENGKGEKEKKWLGLDHQINS